MECRFCKTPAGRDYDPETGEEYDRTECSECWGLIPFAPWCGCLPWSTHTTPVVENGKPGALIAYLCTYCNRSVPTRESEGLARNAGWHHIVLDGYGQYIPRRSDGESDVAYDTRMLDYLRARLAFHQERAEADARWAR